jgi:hypothetical protein
MAKRGVPTESEALQAPLSHEAVRESLAAILASAEFRASKRSQEFLRFVVEQSLAGRAAEVKERTVGVEVFGRTPSYDTNEDGIVRIKASEVRRRLGLYYASEGKLDKLRIELPVGGYAPHFSAVPDAVLPAVLKREGLVAPRERSSARWKWTFASAALLIALALFAILRRPAPNLAEQFWQPLLRSPGTVLIAAAYVPVYEKETTAEPGHRFGDQPFADGYFLLPDQYVGGGDLVAATRVAGLLSSFKRGYEVRVGSTAFEDLKSEPTVLIGYSSDQWAAVSSRLRYFIDDEHGIITDNGKPTAWYPHNLTRQFHTDEDYAIISRVFDAQTHAMRLEVTGITQYGTEGAAEVVTSPDLLRDILKNAPSKWRDSNLQLVLRMNVIHNYPATPKLIAAYYW